MSIRKKLKELRKIASLHLDWLSYVLLQDDTNEEELRKYGKLPMDKSIDLVKYSHKLGQLRMMMKQKEYKDLKFSDLEKEVEKEPLTPPEQATVEQGRHAADDGIRHLAGKMIKSAMKALYTRVTAHAVSGEADVAQALAEDPKVKKLLGSLASSLLVEYKKEWERQLYTEIQVAKNRGAVQAIIQKKGPYQGGDGIDSRVSIVPRPNACEDCVHHYMDGKNPRIFVLKDLIEAGTNADPGVKHTRKNGIHNHWKSTLSPLHLGCGCRIQYLPPGTSWENGKMVVHAEDAFKKAVDAHAKTQSSTPPPAPGSVAGLPAPGNTAGPGKPASIGGGGGGGTPGVEYDYWPKNKGTPEEPGWKATASGESFKRPKGMGGAKHGQLTDEHKNLMAAAEVDSAKKWNANDKADNVVLDHISKGRITTKKDLSEGDDEAKAGVSKTYRITIDGNGRAAMKPSFHRPEDEIRQGLAFGAGAGSIPPGTEANREVAAYRVSQLLGGMGGVPPTSSRFHQGEKMSVQSWKEKTAVTFEALGNSDTDITDDMQPHEMIINNAPPQAMNSVRQKLQDTAALDIVLNNNDRHFDNLTITEDGSDFYAIDHGFSLGTGLTGHRGDIHKSFHLAGEPLKLSDTAKARLDNTSYGDYKRAMAGSGAEDWAVAQTFLRSRYVSDLQEVEGHLDFEKFRSTMSNGRGEVIPMTGEWKMKTRPEDVPEGMSSREHTDRAYLNAISGDPNSEYIDHHVGLGNMSKAGATEFMRRKKEGLLPDQMFNSWAKDYLDKAAADPSHKDHQASKNIQSVGAFVGGDFTKDPKKYKESGHQAGYANMVKPRTPPAQVGRNKPLTEGKGRPDVEEHGSFEEPTVIEKGLTYVGEE